MKLGKELDMQVLLNLEMLRSDLKVIVREAKTKEEIVHKMRRNEPRLIARSVLFSMKRC